MTLEPLLVHAVGLHENSRLVFSMTRASNYKFTIAIEATILACQVLSAGFSVGSYAIGYNIGDRGYSYKLPDVVQKPACE